MEAGSNSTCSSTGVNISEVSNNVETDTGVAVEDTNQEPEKVEIEIDCTEDGFDASNCLAATNNQTRICEKAKGDDGTTWPNCGSSPPVVRTPPQPPPQPPAPSPPPHVQMREFTLRFDYHH